MWDAPDNDKPLADLLRDRQLREAQAFDYLMVHGDPRSSRRYTEMPVTHIYED